MPADYRLLMRPPRPGFTEEGGTLSQILGVADAGQKFKREQQEAQESRAINQVLTQFADDPDEAVMQLRRSGMHGAAMKLGKELEAQKKAIFETRKSQLEGLRLEGQITAEQAKAEREAMEAESPEKMLPWVAAARTPEDRKNADALVRLKFGKSADPFLATIPQEFSPEFSGYAGRVVMGPAAVADDARMAENAERTDATTAANQLRDDQRAEAAAKATEAYRNAQLGISRQRLARQTSSGGGAPISAGDKALVESILRQPSIYKNLTPTVKARIAAELEQRGFIFQESSTAAGRPVTSGDAGRISEFDTSLDDVKVLRETLTGAGSTGAQSQLGAMLPNFVTEFTGIGEGAKQRQAQIDRIKQVIGKALEGGVLRAEDEKKYVKILPTISDPPEVVKTKLKGLEDAIKLRRERLIESLADAGYDTSRYVSRGTTTTTIPPRPAGVPPSAVWTPDASRPGGGYWKAG